MKKIDKIDFFKKQICVTQTNDNSSLSDNSVNTPIETQDAHVKVVQISQNLIEKVKKTAKTLKDIELDALANEVGYLFSKVIDEHFTVAVVGEFNKGKSTLINKFLGKEALPISLLPTTALLTKITYGVKDRLIVTGSNGKIQKVLPLTLQSWEGLTAANFNEKEPEGFVIVEIDNQWMEKYRVDILDTPGAGDLENKRARRIEKALIGADAAIVTISALKMLSLTEQEFIRHKIMAKEIPFMAIALTQLDMINANERETVISFLFKKLEQLKIRVPVFVADDNIEIPNDKYQNLIGFNRFKHFVVSWLSHENRRELTEKWLTTNVQGIIYTASQILEQQRMIVEAKGDEKEHLIAKQNMALTKVHDNWQSLREEMSKRCDRCASLFCAKAKDLGEQITEKLQHEAGRQANPKVWLEEEYAYRVKIELAVISQMLDNLVANQIRADLQWLNAEMEKQFKAVVKITPDKLQAKENFRPEVDDKSVKFENLRDQSTKATIMSSALTLGAALLLGVSGAAPLILATMGVGSGANIIAKKILENKGDEQRRELKKLIAEEMPRIIQDASSESIAKIRILYNDIIRESLATETCWMETHRSLNRQRMDVKVEEEAINKLSFQIKAVKELKMLFLN